MTTSDRARELAEEWHCSYCPWHPVKRCDVVGVAIEITALLDLLVEARDWLDEEAPKLLIEKIDKVLGEK